LPTGREKREKETPEMKQASRLVVEERGSVSEEPVHSDRLDAVASSPSWPDLKNNDARCSKRKTIGEHMVISTYSSSP
jgi:hypothetical protein